MPLYPSWQRPGPPPRLPETPGLRVFSYGGGVQSTAVLVLTAEGFIPRQPFLFANVGEDSENPATIEYFHEHAAPFAAAHGIELIELHKPRGRGGEPHSLLQEITEKPRSIPIPVRLASGGFGNRSCTWRFKIKVVGQWTKNHGATEQDPAQCGIGFSIDEMHRANDRRTLPWQVSVFPLLQMGVGRSECEQIIAKAGLPRAAKSACWFCPFHDRSDWRRQAQEEPDLFTRSVALEAMLNDRRRALGRDPVWLSDMRGPLPTVLGSEGDGENEATCDAFSCFT